MWRYLGIKKEEEMVCEEFVQRKNEMVVLRSEMERKVYGAAV